MNSAPDDEPNELHWRKLHLAYLDPMGSEVGVIEWTHTTEIERRVYRLPGRDSPVLDYSRDGTVLLVEGVSLRRKP